MVNGLIGPAEASRFKVETILSDALGVLLQPRPFILAISSGLFWVHFDGVNYTVNRDTKQVSRLEDIEAFNKALIPMFQYAASKTAILYD